MGVVSNSIVKPRIQHLIELEPRDVLEIHSRVKATKAGRKCRDQARAGGQQGDRDWRGNSKRSKARLYSRIFARRKQSLFSIDGLDPDHFFYWTLTI